MEKPVKRKVYYYKIEAKLKNQDVDIYSLFGNLLDHDITNEDHHYRMQTTGHTVVIKVDNTDKKFCSRFCRIYAAR